MINKTKTYCFGIEKKSLSYLVSIAGTIGMNMSVKNNMLRLLCHIISVKIVPWFIEFSSSFRLYV